MKLRTFFCIILTVILASALPLNTIAATQSNELSLSAKSAVLIDLDEKDILYQKNANERLPMASTTKIVTALLVCELRKCDAVVKIPAEAVGIEGSSVYLHEGELLTVEQLLNLFSKVSGSDEADDKLLLG